MIWPIQALPTTTKEASLLSINTVNRKKPDAQAKRYGWDSKR
jgi:hypothetical protein